MLKDKELPVLSILDIDSMENGDLFHVYLDAPLQTSGYFLGYSGSVTSNPNDTDIYSTIKERAYLESKLNTREDLNFIIEKRDGNTILYREHAQEINERISATVRNCIMSYTSGTPKFLGVSGSSVIVTTNSATAVNDDAYHWDFISSGTNRFMLYNPSSEKWIRYNSSTWYGSPFSINSSSGSRLYVSSSYTQNSGFTIGGTSGNSGHYMYLTSSNALSSNTSTKRYWKVYTLNASPNISGTTTSGRSPKWGYPRTVKITQATGFSGATPSAGLIESEILRISQETGSSWNKYTMYLTRGSTSGVQYSTGGTSLQSGWMIFNKDAQPTNQVTDS